MSQISRELEEQQAKNVADAMEKVFGNIPTIDYDKERMRFLEDKIREEGEKARAESAKR